MLQLQRKIQHHLKISSHISMSVATEDSQTEGSLTDTASYQAPETGLAKPPPPNTSTQSNKASSPLVCCRTQSNSQCKLTTALQIAEKFSGQLLIHAMYLASTATNPESHRYRAYCAISVQCFEHSLPIYSLDYLTNKIQTL